MIKLIIKQGFYLQNAFKEDLEMSTTSKTAEEALNELIAKLKESDCAVISDLALPLADGGLYNSYIAHLPHGKDLDVSVDRQRPGFLYSATCTLIDAKPRDAYQC